MSFAISTPVFGITTVTAVSEFVAKSRRSSSPT
jgi:hypothetical protein